MFFDPWFAVVGVDVLSWSPEAPHLSGDEQLVDPIATRLSGGPWLALTPTGPFVAPDASDPLAVLGALWELFGDDDVWLSPDAPTLDDAPEDAVA